MTEQELKLLGFEKQIITDDESGNGYDYYYYRLKITDGLMFISNTNDEVIDDTWYIEIVDCEPSIKFETFGEAQALINQLKKHICPKKSSKTT